MKTKNTVILSVISALVAIGMLVGYLAVLTPRAIMQPRLEHAHVRLQLIVDGAAINLGDERFQQEYGAVCTDNISEQPIHLHDNKDQFVHLHWKDVTGGLILKNYGWNFIGGKDDTLGYRFDRLPFTNRVATYGTLLPTLSNDASFWVYTGDKNVYNSRALNDFLQQDIETFLNKKSAVSIAGSDKVRDLFSTSASVHAGHDHASGTAPTSEEEKAQVQNLLGNIVLFAQKTEPSEHQIKERFAKLEPLPLSTCGG